MTPAERQRRRREQMRAGGAKDFVLTVEGLHLEHVEALAQADGISTAAALRLVLINALDRYVGVMRRSQRMLENGVSDEVRMKFIREYLSPELPPMPKKLNQSSDAE